MGLNQIDQVPWMLERVYFSYVYHIITLFVFRLSSISRGMWPWEKKRIWLSFEFFHYMYHIINVLMCRPSSIFKKVYSKKLRANFKSFSKLEEITKCLLIIYSMNFFFDCESCFQSIMHSAKWEQIYLKSSASQQKFLINSESSIKEFKHLRIV